ncbi:UNVERIFIED_ORG: lipoprotein-releasing system permease protein [Idiomarina abyssalis]|uniref:ABC-type transport system, involved in lipoprotein release, permease component n=1 Tax=Idiomarina loihiensis (strain ATCC BAA-735 / DSM 15497 / L2-TR) TaxID=283942 RepID=Q5QU45_IDILO|nr:MULTISPECIES: lipoprotein-releasing ABC transporter permease subunit [Idiomarina]AAV82356.1 ABC-type transport system, involved in lipoprotein release, permease component [Idiomarina loihiensis L2TR]AGM36390.1 lipoprotein release ABC transporter permease [Idiomarina loihiensis GSL 199]MAA62926.1 lipoprotein-releasing system transmembrane subunit, LolC/LolE family [Idiomarina sp.]TDO53798.1 lipoprotein-releasing system permease protein [Idiomarina sp. 017G]
MFQPVVLFIGLRYSRARQGSAFTAFINRFAFAGIALGVMALVVVMSVMNGFEGQLKERILGAVPQVTLTDADSTTELTNWRKTQEQLPELEAIKGSMPYVQTQGILQFSEKMSVANIQGIYPDAGEVPLSLEDKMVVGDWLSLTPGSYHLIIGQRLAQKQGITVGDNIRIIAAQGGVYTPFGLVPSQRRFVVTGFFSMGSEVDESVVFAHGSDLARLIRLPEGKVSGLQLFLDDAFKAPQVAESLRNKTQLTTSDWRQNYGQLFEAVGMEKRMMWLMLALIIAVAAFNTLSALIMVINDKRHDIAILQTLGLSNGRIRTVFLLQGLYNGVLGSLIGVILGLILSWYLNDILALFGAQIFAGSDEGLPIIINVSQVIITVVAAITLTLVATLYPASQAAHVQPSEALRYD